MSAKFLSKDNDESWFECKFKYSEGWFKQVKLIITSQIKPKPLEKKFLSIIIYSKDTKLSKAILKAAFENSIANFRVNFASHNLFFTICENTK